MAGEIGAEELFQLGAAVVVPRINVMKRSACIEGARMALARVKTYWAEMETTVVASRDSDKSRVSSEHYFQEVLEGARVIETRCPKDAML